MPPKTLAEYYQSKNTALPELNVRAQDFEKYGLGKSADYQGTADQNTSLLGKLTAVPNPALAGINTGSGVASSTALENTRQYEEQKKKEDEAKKAAEQEIEIARLSREKTINELKGVIAPAGGAPTRPDLEGSYRGLRSEKDATGNSIEDYSATLAENRKKRADIESSLAEYTATLSEGQSESAFLAQKGEKQRLAQTELDRLDREGTLIQNQITNRTNVINTLMGFKGDDYANSKAAYDAEFSKNMNVLQIFNSQKDKEDATEERAKDNARANLQIIQNEIAKGAMRYDKLDAATQATIDELEQQAGLPRGFTSFVTANVKGDVLSTASRTAPNGVEYFDVITRTPEGKISVTSIARGAVKNTDSTNTPSSLNGVLSKEEVAKLNASGIPEGVYTRMTQAFLRGATKDEVREALRTDKYDPGLVDKFDRAVGINKLLNKD